MGTAVSRAEAKGYVDDLYKKVAQRWQARVTDSPFMRKLRSGTLPQKALCLFFKNWGSFTIEINTV